MQAAGKGPILPAPQSAACAARSAMHMHGTHVHAKNC